MLLEMANFIWWLCCDKQVCGVGAPVFSRGGAAGAISHGEMGGLATKLGFYFGIGPKVARFFTPSAQVVGFWRGAAECEWARIGVDFGRFLLRIWVGFGHRFGVFVGLWGEGGRRWACARVASGAGRRKKVHPTAHALWDAPKKGIMGRKSVENLSSARRRVGAALRGCGGVRRFSLRGRGQPLSDGAEVEFRGSFLVGKGGRLTGWDDYLWAYFSYSLMYSITRSMASGRMSLMRGLLTQSYTMG